MHALPSPSHLGAGLVAVLVGFTSSAAIIFQAAAAAGADAAQASSWLWALCLGCGLTSIGLSLYYRAPLLTAWSTPGAALLAGSLGSFSMAEAVGAFLLSAALITLSGVTGLFARLMQRIPQALAAAMLAGVLLRFGLDLFVAGGNQPLLVGSLFAAYLLSNSLAGALQEVSQREPALITFLVTASGVSLLGVGAAFWGLVAGALASAVLNGRLNRRVG